MEFANENSSVFSDRTGLKNSNIFSTSKKLTALSDVQNTVHRKNHDIAPKQLLVHNDLDRELRTPSPCRTKSPMVKFSENKLDDHHLTSCRCCLKNEEYEDNFLPDELVFSDDEIKNIRKVWYGEAGRDVNYEFAFSPVLLKKEFTRDALELEFDIPINDSGIVDDIDLEVDDVFSTFELS